MHVEGEKCMVSTGIDGSCTFGTGELDEYGYWEFPCRKCAKAYEERNPGEVAWPFGVENLPKWRRIPGLGSAVDE
jgi:hypothetical protein